MITILDDYNWAEVFGEGTGGNCTPITPNRAPGDKTTPTHTFSREDVVYIGGISEGENDGPDWVVWGRLKDDRWFVARGGCDYTGWDCQASNNGDVASSLEDILRYGLDESERARFEIVLPPDEPKPEITEAPLGVCQVDIGLELCGEPAVGYVVCDGFCGRPVVGGKHLLCSRHFLAAETTAKALL